MNYSSYKRSGSLPLSGSTDFAFDFVEFQRGLNRRSLKPTALNVIKLNPSSLDIEYCCYVLEGVIHSLPDSEEKPLNGYAFHDTGFLSYRKQSHTEYLPFNVNNVEPRDQRLTVGAKVRFAVVKNKLTHVRYARNVELITSPRMVQGIIRVVKESFGFIERADNLKQVLFHCSELTGNPADYTVGSEVEFEVQYTGREVATKIKLLPKNTIVLDDIDPEKHIGRIVTPAAQPASNDNTASESNDALTGTILYDDEKTKLIPIRYGNNEIIGQNALFAGDIVEFNVATSRRDGTRRATQVRLLASQNFPQSEEQRFKGTITKIDASCGEISLLDLNGRARSIPFKTSEIMQQDIAAGGFAVGSHVEFSLFSSGNAGGGSDAAGVYNNNDGESFDHQVMAVRLTKVAADRPEDSAATAAASSSDNGTTGQHHTSKPTVIRGILSEIEDKSSDSEQQQQQQRSNGMPPSSPHETTGGVLEKRNFEALMTLKSKSFKEARPAAKRVMFKLTELWTGRVFSCSHTGKIPKRTSMEDGDLVSCTVLGSTDMSEDNVVTVSKIVKHSFTGVVGYITSLTETGGLIEWYGFEFEIPFDKSKCSADLTDLFVGQAILFDAELDHQFRPTVINIHSPVENDHYLRFETINEIRRGVIVKLAKTHSSDSPITTDDFLGVIELDKTAKEKGDKLLSDQYLVYSVSDVWPRRAAGSSDLSLNDTVIFLPCSVENSSSLLVSDESRNGGSSTNNGNGGGGGKRLKQWRCFAVSKESEGRVWKGTIAVLKPRYGFLNELCTGVRLFFHSTAVVDFEQCSVGDVVQFNIQFDPESGKFNGVNVQKGTIVEDDKTLSKYYGWESLPVPLKLQSHGSTDANRFGRTTGGSAANVRGSYSAATAQQPTAMRSNSERKSSAPARPRTTGLLSCLQQQSGPRVVLIREPVHPAGNGSVGFGAKRPARRPGTIVDHEAGGSGGSVA